jgi:rubrerythrin
MSTPSLLDAVRVVKENEKTATNSYAEAARKIDNQLGKTLFEELSKFEAYHFEMLTALEKSLVESGKFIKYKGREFPQPPVLEVKAAQEPNSKSLMGIISQAIDLEKQAEKAYADLANQVADPQGYEMFAKLSEEEHKHFRLLTDAFWTLSNFGEWKYVRP